MNRSNGTITARRGRKITLDQIYDDVTLPPLAVGEGEEWEDDEKG